MKQEEEGNHSGINKLAQISHKEKLASSDMLFFHNLDEWIRMVISDEESKGVSFANGKREDVKTRMLNSYCNILQASIDFYREISQIISKQGYEKEAERYRLIDEIYDSIRFQNEEEEVPRRTFDEL
jgi:hypothetical protein